MRLRNHGRVIIALLVAFVLSVLGIFAGQSASAADTSTVSLNVSKQSASTDTGALKVSVLGDSYAAGLGGGDYDPASGPCLRSSNSAAHQLARQLQAEGKQVQLTDVSCAAATVATVRATQLSTETLPPDTNLVMLSIGGNDAGFIPYGQTCITADCSGAPSQAVLDHLNTVGRDVYLLIRDITTMAPHATVVMMGYGQILTPSPNTAPGADPICVLLDPNERLNPSGQDVFHVQVGLEWTLRAAALLNSNHRVKYVSPYSVNLSAPGWLSLKAPFKDRSLCKSSLPESLYHGFDVFGPGGDGLGTFHFKKEGYGLMADLVHQFVA